MLADATESLITVARNPAASDVDFQAAVQAFVMASRRASIDDANQAMRRFRDHFHLEDVRRGAFLALLCGGLIENGCDPTIIAEPLTEQLRYLLERSVSLAEACIEQMPSRDENRDPMEVLDEVRQRVAAGMPEHNAAWEALQHLWPPAIVVFSLSNSARAAARPLRALAEKISRYHVAGHWLRLMLAVLDQEPILVLEPETSLGLVGQISGVVDNFQLNVLIMDAFPKSGWFARRRVSRRVADIARGQGPQQSSDIVVGAWNLYTWQALRADLTLPDRNDSACWIWNEGLPEDIPLFEGHRVVLLGPRSYPRSWPSQRMFSRLPASLQCERLLTKNEVCDWLQRMAAAKAGL